MRLHGASAPRISISLESNVNDQSYTTAFTVDRRPDEAFNAINNVRDWWEDTIAGPTHEVGDEFTHWVPGVHYARIRVTELVRGRTVAWRVLDNWMSFIGDQREWKGTEIRFDIAEHDGMTEVRFTHVGLVPQYECFEVCQDAWGTYVNDSLRSLIATGMGKPTGHEIDEASAELRASLAVR
jgi:hypothetical protein